MGHPLQTSLDAPLAWPLAENTPETCLAGLIADNFQLERLIGALEAELFFGDPQPRCGRLVIVETFGLALAHWVAPGGGAVGLGVLGADFWADPVKRRIFQRQMAASADRLADRLGVAKP